MIATKAQEHLKQFSHIKMTSTPEEFISAVRHLIAEQKSPAKAEACSQSVRTHDWKYRVHAMLEKLNSPPTEAVAK